MKLDSISQYRNARRAYLDTQGECAHWDYENPEGAGLSCCIAMNTAKDTMQRLKTKMPKPAPYDVVRHETAYGRTSSLSFGIKVF